MAYETVLIDLDHTLFDTDESEAAAFAQALALVNAEPTERLLADYQAINQRLWGAVEHGKLSPDVVRVARFRELVELHGFDARPVELAERFADGLKTNGSLYPGAEAVLEEISKVGPLALVTNGLSDIQRARIRRLGLESYFDVIVVSAEVGVAKPDPAIFAAAFERLGDPPPETALMVGDSLSSDMAGAHAFGIDGCWYNPARLAKSDTPPIRHEIASLAGLVDLVLSGES